MKAIISLPNLQLEKVRSLADSYAPDLANNISKQNTIELSKISSTNSNNQSNFDQAQYDGFGLPNLSDKNKRTPYINEYDKVVTSDEQTVANSTAGFKQSNSQGFNNYKQTQENNNFGELLDENDES